jgi:hypothetical protein
MLLLVKLLRRKGVRIAIEEIQGLPRTYLNVLTQTDADNGRLHLTTRGHDDGTFGMPRLELYQVTLASFDTEKFVLRGVERVDTGGRLAAVVQELACKPACAVQRSWTPVST